MGGPKQKGIVQYCKCNNGICLFLSTVVLPRASMSAISPFEQNAMHGALRGYIFYGYKRIMQQAPYFAIPVGIGE